MQENSLVVRAPAQQPAVRLRDVVAAGFRHRRLVTTSFVGILLGAIIAALLLPAKYEAEMKILVKNRRMDPIVSADQVVRQAANDLVTEEQVNSEVELLKSDDVLRRVVIANGLQHRRALWPWHTTSEAEAIAKTVKELKNSLVLQPISKTDLIVVKYRNSDPQLAATVLNTLGNVYLEKKMEIDRPAVQHKFFTEQAERYKKQLADAEAKLQNKGGVAPEKVRDNTLQKLTEFQAALAQTQVSIRETEQRVHVLHGEERTVPARLTTQVRKADNPQLLQHLKGALVDLELRRVELLTKYQPGYRLVQEVDHKIAETKTAIAQEQDRPVRDETTDQNPINQWVRSELAKAEADLMGLRARAQATAKTIAELQTAAAQLNDADILHQDLARAVKTAEENYLLYVRKSEEARISEELDRNRILNVAIADEATPPVMRANSRLNLIALGLLLAMVVSSGLAFVAEWVNPYYRTPHEVTTVLDVPVLAVLPYSAGTIAARNEDAAARRHRPGNDSLESDETVGNFHSET